MCKMINQYADKIKGQFSFFDRMIINGYFRPLRDFTEYFKNVTDLLIRQLSRYAEVSKTCNQRLINAMTDIVPVRSIQEKIGKLCCGKTIKGRHVSEFNVWAPDVLCIMEAVSDGR